MKAISLWQPWATFVALGVKTIETRSWKTSYRGPLAIHAAKRRPDDGYGGEHWQCPRGSGTVMLANDLDRVFHPMPLGAIVATCSLVDVAPMLPERGLSDVDGTFPIIAISRDGRYVTGLKWKNTISPTRYIDKEFSELIATQRPYGDFAPDRFAWILEDITPMDPVPVRGRQGLWDWST